MMTSPPEMIREQQVGARANVPEECERCLGILRIMQGIVLLEAKELEFACSDSKCIESSQRREESWGIITCLWYCKSR